MAGTELAKAYVQIIPSANGIKGKLTSALGGEASSAGDAAGKTAGLNLGSAIKKVVAAAGIGVALKKAISEGANLEQSIGGIETLFKKSSDKVIENAKQAYMTSGLSANAYMESVTSFSASLLQGLAGDTNKAADIADMAMVDMSDNANKMGTDMQSIQNAYQGFAKQNYTMLDNLKLGYGGTKSEMQRLLADAEKFSGVKYDINNLSDVYSAIHVIQGELDITGTTAKEASTTLSGSFNSVKASISNVLGSLALGEDIKPALEGLIETSKTFFLDNLLPMVKNVVIGVIKTLPTLIDGILQFFEEPSNVAAVLNGAVDLFMAIVDAIPEIVSLMIEQAPAIIDGLVNGLNEAFPELENVLNSITEKFDAISNWISEHQDAVIILAAAVGTLTTAIVAYNVAQAIKNAGGIVEIAQLAATAIGVGALTVAETAHSVASTIAATATAAFSAAVSFLTSPITLVIIAIGALIAVIVLCVKHWDEIKAKVLEVADKIKNKITEMKDSVVNKFQEIKTKISEKIEALKSVVVEKFNIIKEKIITPIETARDKIKGIIDKIKGFFSGLNLSLPKIKMPHFKLDGKLSLSPPSVPKFSIDWYAKAMNKPMIMTSPTAFGINSLGQIKAGGENGSEVVSGTDTLMNMIGSAVASQNRTIDNKFEILLSLLYQYLPQLSNLQIVLDSGKVVGETAPAYDKELGNMRVQTARGW